MNDNMLFLYLKTHNKTGLKYIGKTIRNPKTYKGSGKYWVRHLKKHGNDVTTEILKECITKEELKQWGLYYSKLWNIIENPNFANLKFEEGDGGDTSKTENYKEWINSGKASSSNKGRKHWNNGKIQIFSISPPSNEFKLGMLPFDNVGAQIGADIQKEKHWITNDEIEYMSNKNSSIPIGFRKGRLKCKAFNNHDRSKKKGVKWWNNGIVEMMTFDPPNDSFFTGRLKSQKSLV